MYTVKCWSCRESPGKEITFLFFYPVVIVALDKLLMPQGEPWQRNYFVILLSCSNCCPEKLLMNRENPGKEITFLFFYPLVIVALDKLLMNRKSLGKETTL